MKRLLILLLPMMVLLFPAQSQGQTTNRAGVVVRFSDGRVQTSCVGFTGESISGLDLLQRTGLDVIAQSSGSSAAVCKIDGDGCSFPAEPCFCKFGGGQQGQYWAYWRLRGGTWQYSAQGAASVRVMNGDVDGWAWGSGSVQSGAQPPVITFEQICPAAPVKPTVPPSTEKPVPEPTVKPTAQPIERPTARPTASPTVRPTIPPTAAIVVLAPTSAPEPTATTNPTPTETIVPNSTPEPTATTTATLTTVPTRSPTGAATPTAAALTSVTQQETPRSNLGSYAIFGVMLTGLLGAIGIAQWRRRR